MRSIFSLRFAAAVVAVFGLLFGLNIAFGSPVFEAGDVAGPLQLEPSPSETGPVRTSDEIQIRRIDFIERVFAPAKPGFEIVDHLAADDIELVIDGERSVFIRAGTPGADYCGRLDQPGANCAVAADLLGEAVVWFVLLPFYQPEEGEEATVRLPAIDELVGGYARLVNGWEVPYDPVLVRLCVSEDFESYREFREELGDDFVSIYTVRQFTGPRRISAVECHASVPYLERSIEDAKLTFHL